MNYQDRTSEFATELGHLPVALARSLCNIAGVDSTEEFLGVALCGHFLSLGHICIDLHANLSMLANIRDTADFPSPEQWIDKLRNSPLCDAAEPSSPLVLDNTGHLYLRRYYEAQRRLCLNIANRAKEKPSTIFPTGQFHSKIPLEFLQKKFLVIAGGPGTGKTTTVARILAARIAQALHSGNDLPSIAALAPTGKAAARLKESFRNAKQTPTAFEDPSILSAIAFIPEEASTIHRALGINPSRPSRAMRHRENPLEADIVVVDESSMIDLSTMTRLFEAVKPGATLILLGDRHQLFSVDAGSVFADICAGAAESHALKSCYHFLNQNYRFSITSGIYLLAQAINKGDANAVVAILLDEKYPDVQWINDADIRTRQNHLVQDATEETNFLSTLSDNAQRLRALSRYQVVTPLRKGPAGVETLNRLIEDQLKSSGKIPPNVENYENKPIIITSNNYDIGLFNGDIGLLMKSPSGGMSAAFANFDSEIRWISVARLPEYETVHAMTIHKTQGSEFDKVSVFLPDNASPTLTRELLYTAVTRARKQLTVYGEESIIRMCVTAHIHRMSGFLDALRIALDE